MITLKTKIGNSVLELEFEGQQDMIAKGAFWTQLPTACTACGVTNIGLFSLVTKDGDDYYGLKCLDCTATLTFHQLKKGGFYITKDDKFSIYVPKDKVQSSKPAEEERDISF